MSGSEKNVVTVHIGGDEYAIRSPADAGYTRELAGYVDQAVREVLSKSSMLQAQKAGILAALAITDELFQARAELDRLRREVASWSEQLAEETEAGLAASDLAGDS